MSRPLLRPALCVGSVLLSVALSGCGQEVTGPTTTGARDPLVLTDSASGLAPFYVGETYSAPLSVSGGAGPYTLRVVSGTLPEGVRLSGQQLTGTPSKLGLYKFTLEATDANLSTRTREYTVNVQALPALALSPTLPRGELRGETRIPLTITAPRTARAARLSWELPEGVQVTRVQPGETGAPLFWRQQGQLLTVDMGFKAVPRSGARVALITLRPKGAVTLSTTRLGFEARDGQGKVIQEQKLPEPPKPPTPASPAPEGSPAPAQTGTPGTGTPGTGTPAPASPDPAPALTPPAAPSTPPGSGG